MNVPKEKESTSLRGTHRNVLKEKDLTILRGLFASKWANKGVTVRAIEYVRMF